METANYDLAAKQDAKRSTGEGVRITHVITEAVVMGGAQWDTFYALRSQHRRHAVELVVGNSGPLVKLCERAGIPVTVVPLKNRLLDPVRDLAFVFRLWKHFSRTRPTIVHTHSSKAGMAGRLAAWLAHVPIIVHTIHGHEFHARQSHALASAIILAHRVMARVTDHFIPVADALGEEFVAAGISSWQHMTTIGSGIDFETFSPGSSHSRDQLRAALGVPANADLIVCIANFLPDKGHDVLLDVALRLRASNPSVVIGILGGWGPLQEWVQAEIVRRDLQQHVLLFGHRTDVPSVLAVSDIYLQTSRREGLSRGLIEAMYSGLPVVASNVGGTASVVVDAENGYLVPAGDAPSTAECLVRLLGDAALRAQMGNKGHNSVVARFSLESINGAIEDLYSRLLSGDA